MLLKPCLKRCLQYDSVGDIMLDTNLPPCGYTSPIRPIITMETPYNSALIIKGDLSRFHCAEVLVLINGKGYLAILDTGSYDCRIRGDVAESLSLTSNGELLGTHPIDGHVKSASFNLDFKLNSYDFVFNEDFGIVQYGHHIILGSKFLSKCKEFRMFGSEGYFELII